jgi:hypothetical protein
MHLRLIAGLPALILLLSQGRMSAGYAIAAITSNSTFEKRATPIHGISLHPGGLGCCPNGLITCDNFFTGKTCCPAGTICSSDGRACCTGSTTLSIQVYGKSTDLFTASSACSGPFEGVRDCADPDWDFKEFGRNSICCLHGWGAWGSTFGEAYSTRRQTSRTYARKSRPALPQRPRANQRSRLQRRQKGRLRRRQNIQLWHHQSSPGPFPQGTRMNQRRRLRNFQDSP